MNLLNFLSQHGALLAGLAVAILDLIFALNPNSNAPDGVLHAFYMWLKSFGQKPQA